MFLLSGIETFTLVSTIVTWVVVLAGVVVLLALLRIVGAIQRGAVESHAASNSRAVRVGGQAPPFQAVDANSGEFVRNEDFLGRKARLVFVTPGCSECDGALSWLRQDWTHEPVLLAICAKAGEARRAIELWRLQSFRTLHETPERSFADTFGVPITPFAMLLDEIGTIVAAGPIIGRDDLTRIFAPAGDSVVALRELQVTER